MTSQTTKRNALSLSHTCFPLGVPVDVGDSSEFGRGVLVTTRVGIDEGVSPGVSVGVTPDVGVGVTSLVLIE